jgi:subtilisin family serine protease
MNVNRHNKFNTLTISCWLGLMLFGTMTVHADDWLDRIKQNRQDFVYQQGQRIALEKVTDVWVLNEALHQTSQSTLPILDQMVRISDKHSRTTVFKAPQSLLHSLPSRLRSRVTPVYRLNGSPVLISDRLVLRFKKHFSTADQKGILLQASARIIERFADGSLLVKADVDSLSLANQLQESGLVDYAEPDLGRLVAPRWTPLDPFYPQQWHLHNTGQQGALPGADIKAEAAWELSQGTADIIIAIIDSGVDPTHEDLDPCKLLEGYDAATDLEGDVRDYNGHGTSCAGVAAARSNNGLGVAGACPNCRVLPIRIGLGYGSLSDLGQPLLAPQGTMIAFDSHIARAFFFAVDQKAAVISNSWGPLVTTGPAVLSSLGQAALDYAHQNGRGGLGAVVLFAAGNENAPVELDGWAAYPTVMAIGASNDQDKKSGYSNWGTAISVVAPSNGFSHLDGAQTSGIWTSDISGVLGYNAPLGLGLDNGDGLGNYTARFGGTSSATPLVAGVAGLLLSVKHDLGVEEVREILQDSAEKIDLENGNYDQDGLSGQTGTRRRNTSS